MPESSGVGRCLHEELGWLIEKADLNHPGCVVPGEALGAVPFQDPKRKGLAPRWGDYHLALRFSRKIDAERAAQAMVPEVPTVAVFHSWEFFHAAERERAETYAINESNKWAR